MWTIVSDFNQMKGIDSITKFIELDGTTYSLVICFTNIFSEYITIEIRINNFFDS